MRDHARTVEHASGTWDIGSRPSRGRGRRGRRRNARLRDAEGRWGRPARGRLRRVGPRVRPGDAVDQRDQARQIAERLASVRELQQRASRVAGGARDVDETAVFLHRSREIALVRERRREAPVCRQVRGCERGRLGQERHRARAIIRARETSGALAQRRERCGHVFERGLRPREARVCADVAVLPHELLVRLLRLAKLPQGEQLRRGLARQTVATLCPRRMTQRERVSELACTRRAHRACGVLAHALRKHRHLGGGDRVRVDAKRVELAGEERLRGRPEIALRDAQERLGERVQSSPPAGSSRSA